MLGLLGKLGKPFCRIKKKYIQYFKTSDNLSFVTSDGKKLKTQPVYYNFKTSASEFFKTVDGLNLKIKN